MLWIQLKKEIHLFYHLRTMNWISSFRVWAEIISLTSCIAPPKMFSLLLFSCVSFSLLKGRDTDGFPIYQEKFIRECIRKFPFCDITLLQQLVRSIAPVEIVSPRKTICRQRWCLSLIKIDSKSPALISAGQRPDGSVCADPGHHRPGGLHGRRVLHDLWRKGSWEEMLRLQNGEWQEMQRYENFTSWLYQNEHYGIAKMCSKYLKTCSHTHNLWKLLIIYYVIILLKFHFENANRRTSSFLFEMVPGIQSGQVKQLKRRLVSVQGGWLQVKVRGKSSSIALAASSC